MPLNLFPPRLFVFLEEDKGSDHDVLAAGSVVGRGWVDAGSVEDQRETEPSVTES